MDQSKIASAKEQVELKVAEHQTDFYQAKYVDRTNDGTKKEYISEKLVQGQETSDFYAEAAEDGIVKVYDKDNREGKPIVTGVILEDGSIKWDDEIVDAGKENQAIQIVATQTITSDYRKGNLHVEITYQGNLSEITLNGKLITATAGANGVYTFDQEITENGNYVIVAKDENGDYRRETIKVTEIMTDMEIWNRADMENFRDKVNNGRTFEGKTIKVMADIDLEGSQSNQWIPIGNYATNGTLIFKGTFEGNGHTISGLYINTTVGGQGLFGKIYNATVCNLNVRGSIQVNSSSTICETGGIVSRVEGNNNIMNCINYVTITQTGNGKMQAGGIAGGKPAAQGKTTIQNCENYGAITANNQWQVGGIIAYIYDGTIKNCKNHANLEATSQIGGIVGEARGSTVITQCMNDGDVKVANAVTYINAGGICGIVRENINIDNCYNLGNVTNSNINEGRVGGILGTGTNNHLIKNCYNRGNITGVGSMLIDAGGILGHEDYATTLENCYNTGIIKSTRFGEISGYGGNKKNCYTTTSVTASQLGDAFIADTTNINAGLPILKWQKEIE